MSAQEDLPQPPGLGTYEQNYRAHGTRKWGRNGNRQPGQAAMPRGSSSGGGSWAA